MQRKEDSRYCTQTEKQCIKLEIKKNKKTGKQSQKLVFWIFATSKMTVFLRFGEICCLHLQGKFMWFKLMFESLVRVHVSIIYKSIQHLTEPKYYPEDGGRTFLRKLQNKRFVLRGVINQKSYIHSYLQCLFMYRIHPQLPAVPIYVLVFVCFNLRLLCF